MSKTGREMKKFMKSVFFFSILIFAAASSCSIEKFALKKAADALTGESSSNVFLTDNDPELVGDALPFTIKMYESLMASIPEHYGLRLQTGMLYIMYANAYIQSPAEQLPDREFDKKESLLDRAKNLYLRGRDYTLELLEMKHPGFLENLKSKKFKQALDGIKKDDVPALYWASAGWVAAYSIDPFDMKLGITLPQAEAMMNKVLELDEHFNSGSVHDFLILYYGSIPEYMGGSSQKARAHFKKAVELSKGRSTSPYLSLASTVSVKEQNITEFKSLLNQALKIDPDKYISLRLQNTINQKKATWMLEHIEDYFVEVK
jgi:predicted anti-sigma-YlaC factor YlaD